MKLWARFMVAAVAMAMCVGFTYSLHSQATKTKFKSNANANDPSGAFNSDKINRLAGKEDFVLQRVRDYHYSGGNVDCPNCKDMYTAVLTVPAPGAKITSISTTAQRPAANNHWYRCQVKADCGRPEFSDPNDARLDCIGKSTCYVNRASDDGIGGYEDDIHMEYQ
jgi:hypothetical protein